VRTDPAIAAAEGSPRDIGVASWTLAHADHQDVRTVCPTIIGPGWRKPPERELSNGGTEPLIKDNRYLPYNRRVGIVL